MGERREAVRADERRGCVARRLAAVDEDRDEPGERIGIHGREYATSTLTMRRYRRNRHVAGRVIDGLAFVITPDDNKLHSLNGAATRLWTLAGERDVTAEEAAQALVAVYDVDEATARRDAAECLEDLVRREILLAVDE